MDSNVTNSKRNSLIMFWAFIIVAFIVAQIPFVNLPFKWIQTYFHEISHGLAAMVTGGSVKSIELNLNGSGLCTTQGGVRFIVAFSGYVGAVLWGALIYTMVDHVTKKSAVTIAGAMIGMIVVSALFWGRDIITLLILAAMLVPFVIILKTRNQLYVRHFLQFVGIYVLLDAVQSPLVLMGIGGYGDDNTLKKLTGIPEIIWVAIWFSIGAFTLYRLWRGHLKRDPGIV